MSDPRVLINAGCATGQLTGVGYYVKCLLDFLGRSPEGPQIGVLTGVRVRSLEKFSGDGGGKTGPGTGRLRSVAKRWVPFARLLAQQARQSYFRLQVNKTRWDLYHEPNYVSCATSVPTALTVCDMSYARFPEFMPEDRLRWLREQLPACVKRARGLITISEFSRREILEHFTEIAPSQVQVTHLGVDPERYNAAPLPDATIKTLRMKHHLPERFVLYLGTLEPRKNIQGLLAAYETLPVALRKEFPLVMAGRPGWKLKHFQPLLDRLRSQGVVHEIGYVSADEVTPLMKLSAFFCFPSFYEGFGLPPLEAAACGVPVLCSNVSALPEVMGDAVVYVDPKSPEAIADGLKRMIEDESLRRTLAKAGPLRARQFTWEKCARATLEAYRNMME